MKKSLNIILITAISILIGCQLTTKNNQIETKVSSFEKILDSFQVVGSILIYDSETNTYYSNDFERSETGYSPASTFKIPNSIIAVELGIIESDTTIIKWDNKERQMDIWEKDLTFKEAFRVSCVPCYQEIALQIGYLRMKDYLEKFNYKEMYFDRLSVNTFWLEGSSKISQKQQIEFLKKFFYSELPISKRTEEIVKNIMLIEKTDTYTFSGKTGWSVINEQHIGWFVGYLVANNKVYFFATNINPKEGLTTDDFIAARIEVTKHAFHKLNLVDLIN